MLSGPLPSTHHFLRRRHDAIAHAQLTTSSGRPLPNTKGVRSNVNGAAFKLHLTTPLRERCTAVLAAPAQQCGILRVCNTLLTILPIAPLHTLSPPILLCPCAPMPPVWCNAPRTRLVALKPPSAMARAGRAIVTGSRNIASSSARPAQARLLYGSYPSPPLARIAHTYASNTRAGHT